MIEELRKIEYNKKPLYEMTIGEDGEPKKFATKTEYGYFHKWVTTDSNEYALVENKNGNVYILSIFDYNIKFIKEFPKVGRVLDINIGEK